MKFFTANNTNPDSVILRLFAVVRAGSLLIILVFFAGCFHSAWNNEDMSGLVTWSGAYPMAILQTGGYPLWFLLTEDGPVHITAIENAVFSSPFVPWPYAAHIRFLTEREDEIVMVINRGGFLKLAPIGGRTPGIAMYYFSGGNLWKQYTAGGFVFYNDGPAAILYTDDRIISLDISPPSPRAWSFNMNSNALFPLDIPSFRPYPEDEGWNVDTLRYGRNDMIYYRVTNRTGSSAEIHMFRTDNLDMAGEEIPATIFFASVPRQREVSHPSLPPLPDGFVYTGISRIGESLFASWEEQSDFSIGAAGFVVIRE